MLSWFSKDGGFSGFEDEPDDLSHIASIHGRPAQDEDEYGFADQLDPAEPLPLLPALQSAALSPMLVDTAPREEFNVSTPAKKRRVRGKGPWSAMTGEKEPEVTPEVPETAEVVDDSSEEEGAPETSVARRDFWCGWWVRTRPDGYWLKGVGHKQKTADARKALAEISVKQRNSDVKTEYRRMKMIGAAPQTRGRPLGSHLVQQDAGEQNGGAGKMGVLGYLLTWNTHVIKISDTSKNILAVVAEEDEDSREFEAAMKELCKQEEVVSCRSAFVEQAVSWAKEAGFEELSVSMEISMEHMLPLLENSECRVHFHVMQSNLIKNARVALGPKCNWSYKGCEPHVAPSTGRGRHATKAVHRGHAYCQVLKKGQVFSFTNFASGSKFLCDSNWVLDWWRLHKITSSDAKRCIVRNRHRTQFAVNEINNHLEFMSNERMREHQFEVFQMLSKAFHDFKDYPDIKEWIDQYSPEKYGKDSRYKFLVLLGPSRMGKTQLALSLWGNTRTYVSQCQGVEEPNLTSFDRRLHKAIIFDEADPKMVLGNKVLFQASSEGVNLCQSKCQQYSLFRWLYQVPCIVSTNKWSSSYKFDPEDVEWLEANAVVVPIVEKLWL